MVNFIPKKQFSILVGKRIRELREDKGFTQFSLAEEAGMHENSIRAIELGTKIPSIYTLYKLSLCLEIELEELVAEI